HGPLVLRRLVLLPRPPGRPRPRPRPIHPLLPPLLGGGQRGRARRARPDDRGRGGQRSGDRAPPALRGPGRRRAGGSDSPPGSDPRRLATPPRLRALRLRLALGLRPRGRPLLRLAFGLRLPLRL